jgi:hypothetical protein
MRLQATFRGGWHQEERAVGFAFVTFKIAVGKEGRDEIRE